MLPVKQEEKHNASEYTVQRAEESAVTLVLMVDH